MATTLTEGEQGSKRIDEEFLETKWQQIGHLLFLGAGLY